MKNLKYRFRLLCLDPFLQLLVMFLVFTLISGTVKGQNEFFQPLGSSYAQVAVELKKKSHVIVRTDNADQIHLRAPLLNIAYNFDRGQLYSMVMQRNYSSPKLARAAFHSYEIYLQACRTVVVPVMEQENYKLIYAHGGTRDMEVALRKTGKKSYTLTVRSWAGNALPGQAQAPVFSVNDQK